MTMFALIYYLYLALIDFYIHMHFLNWIKMIYFLEQILNPRVTCFFGWREYGTSIKAPCKLKI